jgi:hypothetical protein
VLGLREEPLHDVLVFVPLHVGEADPDGSRAGGDDPGSSDPEGLLPAFLDRLAQLPSRERSCPLDPQVWAGGSDWYPYATNHFSLTTEPGKQFTRQAAAKCSRGKVSIQTSL